MITTAPSRSHALDTLRALAILLVLLFHLGLALPAILIPLASIGWMGVDLFFVLSGYLIGTQLLRPATLGKKISLLDFYKRRAWRILPAYWTVLALYFFIPAFREEPGLAHPWQFLTFTYNITANYAHTPAFSQSWSLCVEEHLYFVLPLLTIVLLRRPSARKTAFVATAVLLAGIALRGWALFHLRTLPPDTSAFRAFYLEHIYFPTWARLDGLLAGVLLAAMQLFRPLWWQAITRRGHLLLGGSGALILLALPLFSDRYTSARGASALGTLIGFPMLSAGLACLLVAAISPHSPLARRIPGVRTLATLAFSLYLTHEAIFRLIQRAFPAFCSNHPIAALPVYASAALGAASALYFIVERPCLLLRDRHRSPVIEALANPAI